MLQAVEWFTLGYFIFFSCYAWLKELTRGQRIKITLLGLLGILITLIVAALDEGSTKSMHVIRDFLPALIMLIAYWQSCCFYRQPNLKLQNKLVAFDGKVAELLCELHVPDRTLRWLHHYLESAYLFCYQIGRASCRESVWR